VEVLAQYQRELINLRLPPQDQKHSEFKALGGVRVEAKVMLPVKVACQAWREKDPAGGPDRIAVRGQLFGINSYNDKTPPRVMIEGIARDGRRMLPDTLRIVETDKLGNFSGTLARSNFDPRSINEVICLFGGTNTLATAGSGYVLISDNPPPPIRPAVYLPFVRR
jgi:hypothetical protein